MRSRIHVRLPLAILAAVMLVSVVRLWPAEAVGQDRTGGPDVSDRVGILSLHVGEIATASLPNLLEDLPSSFENEGRYILQLDGPIDPARRDELETLGVVLEDYMPHFAYVARLGGVAPAALSDVSSVAWVGRYPDAWKIDVEFGTRELVSDERRALAAVGLTPVLVTLFKNEPAQAVYEAITAVGGSVHWIEPVSGNVTMSASIPTEAIPDLPAQSTIQFIEEAPEIVLRNNTNRWIVQSNQNGVTPLYAAGLHGEGQVVGILDGRVSTSHCSFSDSQPIGQNHRKILAYNTSTGTSTHGTHVAGTVTGDPSSDTNNRGVAYLGKFVYDTTPSFTESGIRSRLDQHHGQGALIHTNSWGDDGTTSYNGLARGFDSYSRDFEDGLVLLAVTNGSSLRNPENAKNLLAVGASQDSPSQNNFCSGGTGPTADGRRKPEIFAPGCSTNSSNGNGCSTTSLTGTSMACPAVAGTGMLVRQYYTEGYYPTGAPIPQDGFAPTGALVKATLLNSAVDMTGIGGYPSNQEGWGRVLADDSLFLLGDTRKLVVIDDLSNTVGLSTGEFRDYPLEVLSTGQKLKITLVFTDVPASASTGTGFAAVNDLDLEVLAPGGQTYRGNVFAGGQSTTGGSADDRNNVEQVHLNAPTAGSWTVRVRAAAVNQGVQGFALVASGDVVPEEPAVRISLPNDAPSRISSQMPTAFPVTIEDGAETVVTSSATLHYRYDGGTFQTTPISHQGGTMFTATLPAGECDDAPEFYLSAEGNLGTVVTNPPGAPDFLHSADVLDETTFFEDDFQSDQGWTIENLDLQDGAWERAVPSAGGGNGDPTTDADGSGSCFVTDNANGGEVDGQATRLISPQIDLSSSDDAIVEFSTWFFNDDGDDSLIVALSPNGGLTWVPALTIGPGGSGGWTDHSLRVADFVVPSDRFKMRFEVGDNPANSTTEAGVDAIKIVSLGCEDEAAIVTCGAGAVNVGCGAREDIITVNGSTGGAERTLVVGTNTPMSFVLDEASAESGDGGSENACIYLWFDAPAASDIVNLPKQLGLMCFGPKLIETRPADLTFNSLGFVGKLGAHDAPPAPPVVPDTGTLEFYSLPTGFGAAMDVTVQGLVPDQCTQGTKPFSATNAVLIRVQ